MADILLQKAISAEKEAKQKALGEFKALPTKLGMSPLILTLQSL